MILLRNKGLFSLLKEKVPHYFLLFQRSNYLLTCFLNKKLITSLTTTFICSFRLMVNIYRKLLKTMQYEFYEFSFHVSFLHIFSIYPTVIHLLFYIPCFSLVFLFLLEIKKLKTRQSPSNRSQIFNPYIFFHFSTMNNFKHVQQEKKIVENNSTK